MHKVFLNNALKRLLFVTISSIIQTRTDFPKKMIVNVAVADLRATTQAHDPCIKLPTSDFTNPLQITQLLLDEQVIAHEECIDAKNQTWYRVNTLQQEFFYPPLGWHGYPGWIQAHQLTEVQNFVAHNLVVCSKLADVFDEHDQKIMTVSIGTRLVGIEKNGRNLYKYLDPKSKFGMTKIKIMLPDHQIAYIATDNVYEIDTTVQESEQHLRSNIIATAKKFIGDWYSWGGRSAQNDDFGISSVDCSSLIHLSFLAQGLQIPRMSHEQFLRSSPIQHGADLQPGDLIFFASITKHSIRMDHVMLYLGDDKMLEATFADEHKVRVFAFQQRMGNPCQTVENGDVISWNNEEFHVHFGSFLKDDGMVQQLRDDALKNKY